MRARGSSRVGQAITGTILIAGISALVMLLPSLHLGPLGGPPAGATGQSQRTADARANLSTDATATTAASASGVGAVRRAPTPTTRPQLPTPTVNQQIGQAADLHGQIVTVDTANSSFTYREFGGTLDTIHVDGSTRYTGAATSLATLTPGRGAEITGTWQSAAYLLASLVNEASDGG